jgi:hypothetical protein
LTYFDIRFGVRPLLEPPAKSHDSHVGTLKTAYLASAALAFALPGRRPVFAQKTDFEPVRRYFVASVLLAGEKRFRRFPGLCKIWRETLHPLVNRIGLGHASRTLQSLRQQ